MRINVIVLIVLLLTAWGAGKGLSSLVKTIANNYRCVTMSTVVSRDVDDHLLRVENTLKACAVSFQQKRLTNANSRSIRDSIASMSDMDTVYIITAKADEPAVNSCLQKIGEGSPVAWSEPHRQGGTRKRTSPVVTIAVPLKDSRDRTYGMLCGDMSLKWLRDIAERESSTEKTKVIVASPQGTILLHPNPNLLLTKADFNEAQNSEDLDPLAIIESDESEVGKVKNYLNYSDSMLYSRTEVPQTGWTLVCSVPVKDRSDMTLLIQGITYLVLFVLFLVIIISVTIVIRWQLHPLQAITKATEQLSKGDFHAAIPEVKSHTEIRDLRDSFVRMQDELQQYIADLKASTTANASMERDLAIAAKIQQGMLPERFPAFPGRTDIDIYGVLHPAKSVGGDLFDFTMRNDKLTFCIGDVSGKGVPAALFMTVVGHLFRNVARRTADPAEICSVINTGMAEGNDQNMFCTLFVGTLDMRSGLLSYCNAGHNAPILVRSITTKDNPDGNFQTEFLSTNICIPTGALAESQYATETMLMHTGDALVLYTDGVTEAESPEKELFGDQRAIETVSAYDAGTMQQLVDGIVKRVRLFADEAEQSDDITLLCIRYKGAESTKTTKQDTPSTTTERP